MNETQLTRERQARGERPGRAYRQQAFAGHGVDELVAVFVGGMVGALLRAGLSETFPHAATGWPWGTFLANVAGTALLAWLFFHLHHGLPARARRRRLLEPGLCGALTTFSTLQLELLRLLDEGAIGTALAYAAASIGLGLAIAWLGVHLTRARQKRRGRWKRGGQMTARHHEAENDAP